MKHRQTLTNFFIVVFAILLLSLAITWLWTRGGYMILGHDTGYRIQVKNFFLSLFYTWASVFHVGLPHLFNAAVIPIHLPEYVTSLFVTDTRRVEQIVLLFWQIVTFSPFFVSLVFIPLKKRRKSYLMLFVAGLLYAVNFFNLQGFSVIWRTRLSIQFLIPLLFFFVWYTLEERRIRVKNLLLLSLITSLFNGGGSPPLAGAPILVLVVTGLFGVWINSEKWKSFVLFAKITLLYVLFFAFLSSFWLLPYLHYAVTSYTKELTALGGAGSIVTWTDMVSKNTSLLNIFRLQALPSWDFETQHAFILPYLSNPILLLGGFITVVFAVSSMIFIKNREQKFFISILLILLLIGMFFSAGSHPPTGNLYTFLLRTVPAFAIFRTPLFKFGMVVHFALSLLAGFTMQSLLLKIQNKIALLSLLGLFVLFILWYHAPYLTGNFFDYNLPFTNKLNVPSYVFETAKWINTHRSPYSRMLMLPLSDDGSDGYTWGYWSPDPLPQLLVNRPLASMSHNPPLFIRNINETFKGNDKAVFFQLLARTGIDTILWKKDFLGTDKKTTSDVFKVQKQTILTSPAVTELFRSGQWTVYEVDTVLPRFFVPTALVPTTTSLSAALAIAGETLPHDISFVPVNSAFSTASPLVVEATDTSCTPPSLLDIQPVEIPSSRILPTSLFYPLAKIQEKSQLKTFLTPFRRNLFLAGKRIFEITELTRRGLTPRTRRILPSLINDAKKTLKNIEHYVSAKTISTAEDLQVIKTHLIAYNQLLIEQEEKQEDIPETDSLFATLGSTIEKITKQQVCTTIPTRRTYHVNLPQAGNYNLQIVGKSKPQEKYFDNQIVQEGRDIAMSKGEHTITLVYPNDAFTRSLPNQRISVSYPTSLSLRLTEEDFIPTRVSFEYRIEEGIAPDVRIASQPFEGKGVKLTQSEKEEWREFLTFIPKTEQSLPLDMELSLCCYQKNESQTAIRDITLVSEVFPKVFIVQPLPSFPPPAVPKISFHRDNLTRYRVHVENATEPFFLQFNEQFDSSWQAYVVNRIEQLLPSQTYRVLEHGNVTEYIPKDRFFDLSFLAPHDEQITEHGIANDYANLWRATKTGTYDIIVEYTPQRLLLVGMVLSLISYSIILILLIMKKGT